MGRIYRRKKTGNWIGDWRDADGRRHQRSLRTKDRKVAHRRLRELELGQAHRAPDPHSLREALEFLIDVAAADKAEGTRRMHTQKGRHLLRVIGDRDVNALAREDVQRFIALRHAEGASRHTVAKELTTLRCALREAGERGKWRGEVAALVPKYDPKYQPRTTYVDEDEFWRLLGEISPQRRLRLVLAAFAGAEPSALDRLQWEHVDLVAGVVILPGSKRSQRFRAVPIHPVLREWLESLHQKSGPVVERWHNPCRDIARACERAGVKRVTPTDLRRTFASWLKQAGVDSLTVAHLMGHTSTRMVERVYGRLAPATYRAAIDQLPGACNAGATEPGAHMAKSARLARSDGSSENKKSPEESELFTVPRLGVEPRTRGFSVPVWRDLIPRDDKGKR